MKKIATLVYILMFVSALTACGSDELNDHSAFPSSWNDLGVISVPPSWTYREATYGGPFMLYVEGEGVNCVILMAVWASPIADPYMIINEFYYREIFAFNDGQYGYMLSEHLLESETLMIWLSTDIWMALSLYYNGNNFVFADNEDLILTIARTLTGKNGFITSYNS